MIHNLEYQPYEMEAGFGEEFEFDAGEESYQGEFEGDYGEFEMDSEFDSESGLKVGFNLPKIGDRSGFELEVEPEEEIFPPDTRVAITDTTKVPFRFICHLLIGMKASDGTIATGRGSGTLISNNHVLTVAHNLKVQIGGKTFSAQKITVAPGRNTSFSNRLKWTPFGSSKAKSWACHSKWEKGFDFQYDFGLITLKEDLGKKTFASLSRKPLSYWGNVANGGGTLLESFDPATLKDKVVNVGGYPGDKCGADPDKPSCPTDKRVGTQFCAYDKVLDPAPAAEPRLVYHRADLKKGQSGSPIWRWDKIHRYLVGIQSTETTAADGSPVRNSGVRITADVLSQLKAWGWRT
jgi:V8-like Glu-specific endopeptidase